MIKSTLQNKNFLLTFLILDNKQHFLEQNLIDLLLLKKINLQY